MVVHLKSAIFFINFMLKPNISLTLIIGTENASDGHYPPGSMSSGAPNLRRRYTTPRKSNVPDSSPASTARRRSLPEGTQKKAASAIFRKLDCKKSSEFKIEVSAPQGSLPVASQDELKYKDQKGTKPETRRALFGQKTAGSRVVPYHEERSEHTVVMSNETGDLYRNPKECEELSQIRKQLVQIETQQSNLIDTLQVTCLCLTAFPPLCLV